MSYALITGGASGLGRSFSNSLADIGYNLILTSRDLDSLALAKKEIEKKYSNRVLIFVADLTNSDTRTKLYEYTKHYDLEVVVNNAGVGYSKDFYSADKEKIDNIINLNIIALTDIFNHYYKVFTNNKNGRIINVASLAAFIPGPYNAAYTASKAYVSNISLAVRKEGKKNGVNVQVLAPGSVKTNFYKEAGTKEKSYKGNPHKVARYAVASKKGLIIPGFKNKIIYFLSKILPKSVMIHFAGNRQKRKQIKD